VSRYPVYSLLTTWSCPHPRGRGSRICWGRLSVSRDGRGSPSLNLDKTKVVVFGAKTEAVRAGGEFRFEGRQIEFADSYRYLGVEVSRSGSWTAAVESLIAARARACHAMRSRCAELGLYDPGLRTELFDSLVMPVLMHGAEVWGATSRVSMSTFGDQESDPTERVHRRFLRSLLGVRVSTPGISIPLRS
jgi:hypothetical protein